MPLFVIPVSSSTIPSILFKISELALALFVTNVLTIVFSLTNDFESYSILQSPILRQVAISMKIARTGRIGRALTLYAVLAILLIIGFYNTLLWSLIDQSGPLHVTNFDTALSVDDYYSGRFWGFEVNGSVTQEHLLARIIPSIGSGYAILSSPRAFRFNPNTGHLPLYNITENSIYLNMTAGAYTQVVLMANNAEGNCTQDLTQKYAFLQRCARDSDDGGLDAAIDWDNVNRGRVDIYVSPPGTEGLTGDMALTPQGSTQFISTTYADSVEGMWGQMALDQQVLTFTHLYYSQTREYTDVGDPAISPTCTKVLALSNTTQKEMIELFSSRNGPASVNYHRYDPQTGVIYDSALFKTSNLSSTAGGDRGNLTFCTYSETRLSLLPTGNVMELPGYQCQAQSYTQGTNGVENWSQCDDGGFGDVPPYKVRANVDASIVLSQPYAFRLPKDQLASREVWDLIPKSTFYIATVNVPEAYDIDTSTGHRVLYGRFYGYSTRLAILMFLPLLLALVACIAAWIVVEDAYFAGLLECFSAYTDPSSTAKASSKSDNGRYPTRARYRRLTRARKAGNSPVRVAFDGVNIVSEKEEEDERDKERDWLVGNEIDHSGQVAATEKSDGQQILKQAMDVHAEESTSPLMPKAMPRPDLRLAGTW
jgi:hypothetical protein